MKEAKDFERSKIFVMKEVKMNGNYFFLKIDFRLILSSVFSPIRSFAHDNSPQ